MAPQGPQQLQRDREAVPSTAARRTPPQQNLLRSLPSPLRVGLVPTLSRQLSGLIDDRQRQENQVQVQRRPWRSQQLGWHTAAIGLVGFTAITTDVFYDSSAHLLAEVDAYGHGLAQSLDPFLRSSVLERTISDMFIFTGMVAWTAMTVYVALNPKSEATSPAVVLGLSWLFYGLLAGRVEGDTLLVGGLKDFFNRARPSPVLKSMSFPSGHTTTATFLIASLLFVLVPVLLHKMETNPDSKLHQWLKQLEDSWPVFLSAWFITAGSRVLGDAHWVSDTLAGGFLSLTVVSVLAKLTEFVLEVLERPEGGEGASAESAAVLVRASDERTEMESKRREPERVE